MVTRSTSSFGLVGTDWQQRINWERLRKYRLSRAREAMKRNGLGALLVMYDENVRYITSTVTPGWCRLKPGLRYALLCEGDEPVLFEQGDIGIQINRHCPWIPRDNVRYAYSWIKGAVGCPRGRRPPTARSACSTRGAGFGARSAAGKPDAPPGPGRAR